MPFTKGHPAYYGGWKKGQVPKSVRLKISQTLKGRKLSESHKKAIGKGVRKAGNIPPSWKGKHHSKKAIEKMRLAKLGEKNYNWKGRIKKQGYYLINMPTHPFCNAKGYIREHRLVMEKHIKRYLSAEEVVHHINGKRFDNRIKNLQLFSNDSEHLSYHHKQKKN